MARLFAVLSALVAIACAVPATAATVFNYKISGGMSFEFSLIDKTAEPALFNCNEVGCFAYISGPNLTEYAYADFLTDFDGLPSGLNVVDWNRPDPIYFFLIGPLLYGYVDGTARPLTGRFEFSDDAGKQYTVEVSSVAVPEPGTWAMMIGGFGLAGAALRRRKLMAA